MRLGPLSLKMSIIDQDCHASMHRRCLDSSRNRVKLSDQRPINDQHIRLCFNQGLTQAEMRDNVQFSPHYLRRR